jgi:hypothetical protein
VTAEIPTGSAYHAPRRSHPSGQVQSLLSYAASSGLGGNAFACKLPSPQVGEAFFSSFLANGKGLAWCPATPCRAVHLGQCLPGARHGHRSWTPSRKWLRAKGCRHDRASKDVGRGAFTTSLRSSAAGEAIAFTMPLVPPALRCFQLVHSHLLWGMSTMAMTICSLDSGCLCLLPASGLVGGSLPLGSCSQPSSSASVQPPCGESLSSAFMERAKRQELGPPGPAH